jgi:hypothetical protein
MSAQTQSTAPRRYALANYLDLLRPRLAAMRFAAVALATAGALSIAPVSQARPDTDEPTTSAEAAMPARTVAAPVSPWRDAWYLDDQYVGAPAEPAHPLDFSPPIRDDWMLHSLP